MRQEQFVARHQHEWLALEAWLQRRGNPRRAAPATAAAPASTAPATAPASASASATAAAAAANAAAVALPPDEEIPQRYRRLCQQLALARQRGYSPQLVARLQQLMQRGHALLYRTPPPRWRRVLLFLVADFPQLVRQQAGYMWVALALFAVPLVASFVLAQVYPGFAHAVMDSSQLAQMERMYDPGAERLGRDSGSDWMMFGHYIMNNISIGLRTFASGLLAGLGTVLVLLFNGITIGTIAGHLQHIGHGDPFWRFVAGHGSFELSAIVIAGGAGLQLGLRVLAPGRQRRVDALVEGGRIGAKLCLGIVFMLLVAAFIEAFWSSIAAVPAWGKFSVAAVLWSVVLVWLWRGGRGDAHAD